MASAIRSSTRRSFGSLFGLWAFAVLWLFAACSSLKLKKGDFELEVTSDPNGNKTVNAKSPELPPGKCLKMTFVGADGNPTGSATTDVPGSARVPANTTDIKCEIVDCDQSQTSSVGWFGGAPRRDGTGSPHGSSSPTKKRDVIDVFGCPIEPNLVDGGIYKNAAYHFRVSVDPGVDPFSIVEPILRDGPGSPVPPNVRVVSFSQAIPEPTGVWLITAATNAFEVYELSWNGLPYYGNLSTATNAVQVRLANGWHVVKSFISMNDAHTQPLGVNTGTVTRKTIVESSAKVDRFEASN